MTPEERLTRIEVNLERFEVEVEKALYGHDLRIQKLTESQAILMESQNQTWQAIARLTENVEKLIRLGGHDGQQIT